MKKVVLLVKTLAVVLLLTLAALLFRSHMPAWPSTLLGKEEGTAKGQIRVPAQLRKRTLKWRRVASKLSTCSEIDLIT